MEIQNYTEVYQRKTDDELLLIAAQAHQLVPEANAALIGEMARRGLNQQTLQYRIGERPEQVSLGNEIMKFLVERETGLADALEALTTVMLHVLSGKYGKRDEFFRFFEQVSRFPGSTERDLAVGWIPKKQPGGLAAKVQPRTVTMVDRPEGILRLATEVGDLITKCGPKSLGAGLDALTGTMLTAIEATCGRERADEFDLLMAGLSKRDEGGFK
ncbi:MAG: hypothetical protein ABSD53_22340 [Terriglobales bacterium]|jgi:hypothetical protein